VICEQTILQCLLLSRFILYISPFCATKEICARKDLTNNEYLDMGTPWPFYGIWMYIIAKSEIQIWAREQTAESLRRITESAKWPTDQTDSELSIKMFAQPRLRRFLSRDKVHNFGAAYKPCCYLRPSEECTFRICLKFIRLSIDI